MGKNPSNYPPGMTWRSRSEPYRQYAIVEATFAPIRTHDLEEGCVPFVGSRLRWKAWWVSEDEPYVDQWVWGEHRDDPTDTDGMFPAWIPTEDLADIDPIHRGMPMYPGEPE